MRFAQGWALKAVEWLHGRAKTVRAMDENSLCY
jgi:hypothetical protein